MVERRLYESKSNRLNEEKHRKTNTLFINSANLVVNASSERFFFDFNAVSSSVSCKNFATSNFAFNCFFNLSCWKKEKNQEQSNEINEWIEFYFFIRFFECAWQHIRKKFEKYRKSKFHKWNNNKDRKWNETKEIS